MGFCLGSLVAGATFAVAKVERYLSTDGVDAALVERDGGNVVKKGVWVVGGVWYQEGVYRLVVGSDMQRRIAFVQLADKDVLCVVFKVSQANGEYFPHGAAVCSK